MCITYLIILQIFIEIRNQFPCFGVVVYLVNAELTGLAHRTSSVDIPIDRIHACIKNRSGIFKILDLFKKVTYRNVNVPTVCFLLLLV